MRLVVFGASGRTGRLLVPMSLDAGHDVTALLRPGAPQPEPHERLRMVIGDVLEPLTLPTPLEGGDAIVVTLGRPLLLSDTLADHARQEAALHESPLDWTIIRTAHACHGFRGLGPAGAAGPARGPRSADLGDHRASHPFPRGAERVDVSRVPGRHGAEASRDRP